MNGKNQYYFLGIQVRQDDIGNIHFGYVGSAYLPMEILCGGAGAYQIISRTSKWYYFASYYDDPRDNIMIRYGYGLAKLDIFNYWRRK